VKVDGSTWWRHLERHELDPAGQGIILHGLYQGTPDNLGRPVPFTESVDTAQLADLVVDGNRIDTQSPGLAVTYIPNQRPQRRWRHDPLGRNLGRSDLDGVESLMDALDETYTSWLRDIRLGKARILASRQLLDDLGPGRGAAFDTDREVFTPLAAGVGSLNPGGGAGTAQGVLQPVEFKIRFAEHQATGQQLIGDICRTAGYSAQTFGENSDVTATATEVQARERRSFMTRDRKARHWRPALADHIEKLLAIDAAIFGTRGVRPQRPTVEFGDSVQESQLTLAQTAQALRGARAASTQVLVELVHPEWDETQVTEEVGRITTEDTVPDPTIALPPGAVTGAPNDPTQP
jgi:hypothetical protein